jgi:uncharacterized protein YecE (DUF72 family)
MMKEDKNGRIYTGTSGIVLPLPNRRSFPTKFHDKSRLEIYSNFFNSVEINSSFYKVPMASTVQKWAASVPEHFQFTFKLWKNITHNKDLAFNQDDVTRFMETIAMTGDRAGCLLIQLPPKATIAHITQLEHLLSNVRSNDDGGQWKVAVEFRNRSWYHEDSYNLLDNFGMGIVLHDMPASAVSLLETRANFVYLRFHGPNGGYRGSYSDDFLYEYATYIKEWTEDGKTVYAYFNNTMGDAVKNLISLNNFVADC